MLSSSFIVQPGGQGEAVYENTRLVGEPDYAEVEDGGDNTVARPLRRSHSMTGRRADPAPAPSLYADISRYTGRGGSRIPVAGRGGLLGPRAATQSALARRAPERELRRGLLWIQQDKLFSSWKERFVILTNSHLQIFRRGTTHFSDVGAFLNKVEHRNSQKQNICRSFVITSMG